MPIELYFRGFQLSLGPSQCAYLSPHHGADVPPTLPMSPGPWQQNLWRGQLRTEENSWIWQAEMLLLFSKKNFWKKTAKKKLV